MNALSSLLFKEKKKLARLGWVPFVALLWVLVNYQLTLQTIMRVHGATATWLDLYANEKVLFDALLWVYVGAGAFWAALSWVPERVEGRVRLTFALPLSPLKSLGVTMAVGLGLMALLCAGGAVGLWVVHERVGLPSDISMPLILGTLPWCLLGALTWLGVSALTLEPRPWRQGVLVLLFYATFSAITRARGLDAWAPMGLALVLWLGLWMLFPVGGLLNWKAGQLKAKPVSQWALGIVAVVSLMWFIPMSIMRVDPVAADRANFVYSPVLKTFVESHTEEGLPKRLRTDTNEVLSMRASREALPYMYRADLMRWKRFPMMVDGHPLTFDETENKEWLRLSTRQAEVPKQTVFALFESEPERAKLNYEKRLLVLTPTGFKAVSTEDGHEMVEETAALKTVLAMADVAFPLKVASENMTDQKPFDEGILMVDAKNHLFNLKKVRGSFLVTAFKTPVPEGLVNILPMEDPRRVNRALFFTKTGVALLRWDGTLFNVPLTAYDSALDEFRYWGTGKSETFTLRRWYGEKSDRYLRAVATNPKGEVLERAEIRPSEHYLERERKQARLIHAVSPVTVSLMSPKTRFATFDLTGPVSVRDGLLVFFLWSVLALLVAMRLTGEGVKHVLKTRWWAILITGALGLPGLVATSVTGALGEGKLKG